MSIKAEMLAEVMRKTAGGALATSALAPQEAEAGPVKVLSHLDEAGNAVYKTAKDVFFDKKTTDMPFYDDLIESFEDSYKRDYFREQKGIESAMVEMSPDEYISLVDRGFSGDVMSGVDPERVSSYAEKMRGGEKFPTLTLDYTRGKRLSQEGRHRALAAKEAGGNSVPVLVDEAEALGVNLNDINKNLRKYDDELISIKERGNANPMLLGGVAATTAAAMRAAQQKDNKSVIKSPQNPITAKLAMALRDGERAIKGSPAELMYPSGLAPWLERLAYKEKPSKMERAMAIADFL